MNILAIDPGPVRSAWLVLDGDGQPANHAIWANELLLERIRDLDGWGQRTIDVVVIEKVEPYGMAVGREVFDTVFWSGRFAEAAHPIRVVQLPRLEVKLEVCHDGRAKDPNIRAALIDRYGGSGAQGTKKAPGPLYGIKADLWAALGVAVTFAAQEERR